MTIQLNGSETETQASNVAELLEELDLSGRPVVVEHQKAALLPKEFATTMLSQGDEIEVITIVAGG